MAERRSISSSSATDCGNESRLMNTICKCGKRAGIRISMTSKNKHKPYYFCQNNECGSFLRCCKLVDLCVESFREPTMARDSVEDEIFTRNLKNSTVRDLLNLKDVLHQNDENRQIHGKLDGLDSLIGNMKIVLALCLICTVVNFILVLFLLCKKG